MSNVFIMGGSGFIGSETVKSLVASGHQVYGLARSDKSAAALNNLGATPVRGDVYNPDEWISTLPDLDYAINALGFFSEGMPARFTISFANQCRDKYTLWAEVLLRLIKEKRLKAGVHVTGTAIYEDCGVNWVTERSPLNEQSWGFNRIAVDARKLMHRSMDEGVPIVVAIAPSVVYGPQPGTSFDMVFVRPLEKGQMGIVGHGRNYITTGHVEDVGRAIAFLTDERFAGESFHISDDQPVTQSQFLHAIAKGAGVKRVIRMPCWVVAILGGKVASEFMSLSQRIDNSKLKAVGFKLKYPMFLENLPAILTQLRADS